MHVSVLVMVFDSEIFQRVSSPLSERKFPVVWNRPAWWDFFLSNSLQIWVQCWPFKRIWVWTQQNRKVGNLGLREKPGKIQGHISCDFPVVWMMHSNIYTEIYKTWDGHMAIVLYGGGRKWPGNLCFQPCPFPVLSVSSLLKTDHTGEIEAIQCFPPLLS